MNEFSVLVNDMLLSDNVIDKDYKYCYEPNAIGIVTKGNDTGRQYFVYSTTAKGRIDWVKERESFIEALFYARVMYRGMLKANYHFSKNENQASEDQIHEEITYEIFRQLLIKNNIEKDYMILFEDDYKFKADEYSPFGGIVNIFKDDNNIWNVWEDEIYEIFMGYFRGLHTDIRQFSSQVEAYIDAAKRRNLNISKEDLAYDVKDIQYMLSIIQSAKIFLLFGSGIYNSNKLAQRYQMLLTFENELLEKNNHVEKVKRKNR